MKQISVEDYLSKFPKKVEARLLAIRKIVKKEAPMVAEKISYGIPTMTLNGKNLIYFGGYKNHVSIYPVTEEMEKVPEVTKFRTGKGTLQFLNSEPLPTRFIEKIVKARVGEFERI